MNLFDIPGISLALSLVVCWALFAILCSLIHEAVAVVKSQRGRFMKKKILEQFNDTVSGINWGLRIYQDGTLSMLSTDPSRPSDEIEPKFFSWAFVTAIGGVQEKNLNSFASVGAKFFLEVGINKK